MKLTRQSATGPTLGSQALTLIFLLAFAAYCLLDHAGDWRAAARHLADNGYGGADEPRVVFGDPPRPGAERSARRFIFLGVFWSYLRGLGPRATPPPRQIGERLDP